MTLALPASLACVFASGCTGGAGSSGATVPSAGVSATSPTDSAAVAPVNTAVPATDAGAPPPITPDAGATEVSLWAPVLTDAGAADAPAPPCWKGFEPTGNAEADVVELGNRCAKGMSSLVPPVKYSFKAGESKSIPVPIAPGCYRVIAVGGKGVKDVDLALKDASGKLVAADMTPDDVFPMIHPNKEFCSESLQFLTLVISVKKGAGDVAGGVWKR